MVLYVEYLGSFWAALGMLVAIFIVNFVSCYLLKYIRTFFLNLDVDVVNDKMIEELPIQEKVFISYSNIFVFSGPLNEIHKYDL